MVDDTITSHSIRKGKKLEDSLEGCLSEITSKLQKNDIYSYYLINKKQGDEVVLALRHYYAFMEPKITISILRQKITKIFSGVLQM